MFWHGGFPLYVLAYAVLKRDERPALAPKTGIARAAGAAGPALAVLLSIGLLLLATAGQSALPAIMAGNHYTPVMLGTVSSVWLFSLVALGGAVAPADALGARPLAHGCAECLAVRHRSVGHAQRRPLRPRLLRRPHLWARGVQRGALGAAARERLAVRAAGAGARERAPQGAWTWPPRATRRRPRTKPRACSLPA